MKQANTAQQNKKNLLLSKILSEGVSPNEYLNDCQQNCFNGGLCTYSSNLSMYICQCAPGYTYTASSLNFG